jgi:hypothetical protein
MVKPSKDADRSARFAKADGKQDPIRFAAAPMRVADNAEKAMNALVLREGIEVGALAAAPENRLHNSERFEQARKNATIPLHDAARGKAEAEKVKPAVAPAPDMPAGPAPMAAGPGQIKKKGAAVMPSRVEYFHQHVPNLRADTLLWHPTLWLEQGNAEVHFDIASGQATYRVLLLAHGPSGRFGFFETRLDVPAVGGR